MRQYYYLLYLLVVVSYLFAYFTGATLLNYVASAVMMVALLLSFIYATNLFKVLGLLFLSVGVYLVFTYDIQGFWLFFNSNTGLVALLLMLPWMNNAVRAGGFDRKLQQLLKSNVSHAGSLYVRAKATSYILVTFINLSALYVAQNLLKEQLKGWKEKNTFISQTTLRAFALALAWSPMEVLVAISVDATGVSYLTLFPWLLAISLITFSIDSFFGKRRYQHVPIDKQEARPVPIMSILHLFLVLSLFLVAIVSISSFFNLSFILTVTLVILPFAMLWSLCMGRIRRFLKIGVVNWKERANGMQNFVVLFGSLAFFSDALNASPVLGAFQTPFLALGEQPLLLFLLIQFTYLSMSMVGIHPIATVSILIEAVGPLMGVINPLSFGIILVTGALATATVGTFGVTVTMTSMNTAQNPYRITKTNMPFALLYGSIGTIVAYLLTL
ncbi:hypothetical protein FLK61_31715 [Paenalkalicoccus suaedae]|uniref:Citrate transporter-like domain-containing protein n=1 Tax=Paenalkalicoccus suaedae TaxID=2592382 RepID=A0A859FDJ8_9BACI|nr:hypothetical protein [Paenalkalicoccus suaedae]QKS71279.1 hypothetical protein FLK61_31715 [Paenalkalicoccus suaedae]